jgi:hypothetical protein
VAGATTGPAPDATAAATQAPARSRAPVSGPPKVRLRYLVDAAGALRAAVPGLTTFPGRATVLLVNADWAVVRVVAHPASVTEYRADLDRLAG